MDERVERDIAARLRRLEKRAARVRIGVVTGIAPLAVELGNSGVPYTGVKKTTGVALAVDDTVAVLMFGNDLLVLGKLT